jgi:mono/diheme cytochrome c family protein
VLVRAAVLWISLTAPGEPADPAAQLFSARCSTCHNVGQGDKVGPDLLGVTQRREKAWFSSFVRGPGAAIDRGDPVATALLAKFNGVRMPNQELSDTELDALWSYFASCTTRGGCLPVSDGARLGLDGSPEEIALGRALFSGEKALVNRGPPCFSCHSVRGLDAMGGSTLGGDLTFVWARHGDEALAAGLEQPTTPVMANVYRNASLTPEERFAFSAWFAALSKDGDLPARSSDFTWLGVEGAALVLGLFAIVWGRR